MGAGTSPAEPARRAAGGPEGPDEQNAPAAPDPQDGRDEPQGREPATGGTGPDGADGTAPADGGPGAAGDTPGRAPAPTADGGGPDAPDGGGPGKAREGGGPDGPPEGGGRPRVSRRFPRFTRDTARPEGGGRAAPGDAPAPARQWPLLSVLCAAGLGLLIVALDPFDQAFRVGTVLIGGALIAGAVLRWVVPSVGMLAVRSRFTDLVTYGLMGTLIVLLALVAQPGPWLDVPVLEEAVRFAVR